VIETTTQVSAARVLPTEGRPGFIHVLFPDGDRAWAQAALAIPYRASEGDRVLVLRQDAENAFIVGVLQGAGVTTLSVPGDLRLEAPHGRISLSAGRDFEIESPRLGLRAGVVEITARRILETVEDAFRWVSRLFQVKAHRTKLLTESDLYIKGGTANLKADGPMNIDGERIHLG